MFYVINKKTGKLIAKCEYQPDEFDLLSRNEFYVELDRDYDLLSYKYENGKFVPIKEEEAIDDV